MIHVVTSANRHLYEPELLTHFRLRHEVYVAERNWKELERADGLERDQFDNQDATYILAIDKGEIVSVVRGSSQPRNRIFSAKSFRILPQFAVHLRMDADVRDQEPA